MKMNSPAGVVCLTSLIFGMAVVFLPAGAIAADPDWRPTYDIAMRWVNFIILAAVIVKFGREPIKKFLKLQKDDVASQIDELEGQKSKILGEIQAVNQQATDNETRLEELKARLITQGENRKQEIIAQAHKQSDTMFEETRRKLEHSVDQAKGKLKMELLDMAMGQVVQRLPDMITEEDNQRMLDDYMRSIKTLS